MNPDETKSIENKTPEVFIGMGGWELQPFLGVFYPNRPGKNFRKLEYYSRFFDLVEVNATFYNTSLTPNQSQQWLKDVSENNRFMFTIKLFRGFTHTFDATKEDALSIHRLLEPLREAKKFGGILAQFPSSFKRSPSREAYMLKLRNLFPEDALLLDLRHRSWDNESFYLLCRDNKLSPVNVDLPRLPNHIPFNSMEWNGVAYYRMMGRNAENWDDPKSRDRYFYPYNEEELKDLVAKIKTLNADKTYVVFHNDKQAFSLVNGMQVDHELNPTKQLKAPANLIKAFPILETFCTPVVTEDNLFPPVRQKRIKDNVEGKYKVKKLKRRVNNQQRFSNSFFN